MFEAEDPRSHGAAQKAHEKNGVILASRRRSKGPDLCPQVGWLLHAQHPALPPNIIYSSFYPSLYPSSLWMVLCSTVETKGGAHPVASWPVWVEEWVRANRSGSFSHIAPASPCLLPWVNFLAVITLLMQANSRARPHQAGSTLRRRPEHQNLGSCRWKLTHSSERLGPYGDVHLCREPDKLPKSHNLTRWLGYRANNGDSSIDPCRRGVTII